jgi:glutathione peroxidase
MTIRQKILKAYYPIFMKNSKRTNKNTEILINKNKVIPIISFYSLTSVDNKGIDIGFDQFRGKKILLVNTASDCGYTAQYDELQKMYSDNKDGLIILGFPSNDFGNQEKGNDEEIAQFCKINFGVTFPLMKKTVVKKSPAQNSVFRWLTDKKENGWNDHPPDWNFSKYFVNEEGILTHYFGSSISPQEAGASVL